MRRIYLIAVPILIAGLVAAFVVARNSGPGGDSDLEADVNTPLQPAGNSTSNVNRDVTDISVQTQITTVSRMFAERYTSTTSADPTANLKAAMPYASVSLRQAFQRTIDSPASPTADVVTVTSRAMAFSIRNLDERLGRADVVVSLQRSERKNNEVARVFTQELSLTLVREGTDWRVSVAVSS